MNPVAQMMKPLTDRVRLMVGRAIVSAVNDAAKIQSLQVELLADEVQDKVEHFQHYGFTSHPFAEAEAILVFPGGLRSHGICIAMEDRRYRIGLLEGEVALYDDLGQVVHLKRDGILLSSPLKVTIDAPQVDLGGAGGQPVARVGDPVSGGVIQSGSATVNAV